MRNILAALRAPLLVRLALAMLAITLWPASLLAQGPPFAFSELSRLPDTDAAPSEEVPADKKPAGEKQEEPVALADSEWDWWSPKFWDPWEGNVELGLNGTDGNTETFNVRFGALAKRKTEFRTEQLQITSIQKRANGATTANTALIDSRIDWPMPSSRFNAFVHNLVEYDQFKAFNCRVSGDAGIGYEFIQNDITTFISRIGASASTEIGGPNNKVNPEILFGNEFKHKFNETHLISAQMSYYPNVTAFSDFRLNSQASWQIVLSHSYNLSLKLSLIDRYDSTPEGAKPNDLDYSTLLLWTF